MRGKPSGPTNLGMVKEQVSVRIKAQPSSAVMQISAGITAERGNTEAAAVRGDQS